MRVAMYYRNNDVRTEDVLKPVIGDDEILIKVMASGICGSDVMEWYRIKKAPRVLGHEISGEISEVGKSVQDLVKGERVFVSHHVPCNTCCHCLKGHNTSCDIHRKTNFDPGGFSEYVRVPGINVERGVFKLPDGLSHEQAVFIEPLACVIRSQRLAGICPGESVAILGCGMAGILQIRLAISKGVGRVFATDINDYRLRLARESGAQTLKPGEDLHSRIQVLNNKLLADKVLVCTGAEQAASQAMDLAERGGSILFYAVPEPGIDVKVPLNRFWTNEIRVLTSYGASPRDIEEAIRLLDNGRIRVDDLVTHRLPLEQAGQGFSLASSAGESMKVILYPHGVPGQSTASQGIPSQRN
jgi:L-iditol 2-dehydrogenase